jgi:hypothetical protein
VKFVRSCDIGVQQQKMLVGRSEFEDNKTCVHCNLHDVLSATGAEMVAHMKPPPDSSKADAKIAYDAIGEYLAENIWAFPLERAPMCLVHKQPCPAHPAWVYQQIRDGAKPKSTNDTEPWWAEMKDADFHLDVEVDDILKSLGIGDGAGGPHGMSEPQGPLMVNISTLTCVDHSPLGLLKGEAGPSMLEHATFVATRIARAKARLEHVYFTECSDRYRTLAMQARLLPTHAVLAIKTGSDKLGHPVKKGRGYGAGVNRLTHVWCGAQTEQGVQEEFSRLFHASVELDGRVYLLAEQEEVWAHMNAMALIRRKTLPSDYKTLRCSEYFDHLSAPGVVHIKSQYEDLFVESKAGAPHFADLAHHPNKGPTHGSLVPSLDTHPKTFTWHSPPPFSGERYLVTSEMLAVQGVDVFPGLSGGRPLSVVGPLFAKHNLNQQGILVGNALHIPTFAAWVLYVMGNMLPVEYFYQLAPQPQMASSSAAASSRDVFEDVPVE